MRIYQEFPALLLELSEGKGQSLLSKARLSLQSPLSTWLVDLEDKLQLLEQL